MATRLEHKAWVLSEAWAAKRNGERPSVGQIASCLSVANAESAMGDAWSPPRTLQPWNNWGATQFPWQYQRGLFVPHGQKAPADALTVTERACLAMVGAGKVWSVAANPHAGGMAAALKMIPPDFNGEVALPSFEGARRALYVDSHHAGDAATAYWIFEAAFATAREGARYFLNLLMDPHPSVTPELLDRGDLLELATAMHGYYATTTPPTAYAAWLERSAGHAGNPQALAGMFAPLEGMDPSSLDHDADDPTPMPDDWGKASAAPGSSGAAPPPSPPLPSPSSGSTESTSDDDDPYDDADTDGGKDCS